MRQQRFSRSRSSGNESGKRRHLLLLLLLLLANPSGRKSPRPLPCPRPHPTQVKHDTALTKALEAREERTRFYLVVTQLDPHTKMLSFGDNKYFHSSLNDDGNGFLSMDFKKIYIQPTGAAR